MSDPPPNGSAPPCGAPTSAPPSAGLQSVQRLRVGSSHGTSHHSTSADDQVVREVPIALVYNGHTHAVMMATPTDLEDFGLGFALNEGIVADPGEWQLVDVLHEPQGVSLQAAIPQRRFDAMRERTRVLTGRSGCGLCGVDSLRAALRPVPRVQARWQVAAQAIAAALQSLHASQPMNAACGGVHAAAHACLQGDPAATLLVREDVGRHNALDKLAGALARSARGEGFVLVTSRASYEMVHKAATMGVGLLAAISAPTALAIDTAEAAGLTLIGFARGTGMNVYTHPERVAG